MRNTRFIDFMRIVLMLLLLLNFNKLSIGQDFNISVGVCDIGLSKRIDTVFVRESYQLNLDWMGGKIDSIHLESSNGVISLSNESYFVTPENIGKLEIFAIVSFENGKILKKSEFLEVILKPQVEMQVGTNTLLTDGNMSFQLLMNGSDVTNQVNVGHFEYRIENLDGVIVYEGIGGGSFQLDLLQYGEGFEVKLGQFLVIKKIRFVWKRYNLLMFTKPFRLLIK